MIIECLEVKIDFLEVFPLFKKCHSLNRSKVTFENVLSDLIFFNLLGTPYLVITFRIHGILEVFSLTQYLKCHLLNTFYSAFFGTRKMRIKYSLTTHNSLFYLIS